MDGQPKQISFPGGGGLSLTVIGALIFMGYMGYQTNGERIQIGEMDILKAGSTLLFFFIIALVVERSIEVLVSVLYGPKEISAVEDAKAAADAHEVLATLEKDALERRNTPEERLAYFRDPIPAQQLTESAQKVSSAQAQSKMQLMQVNKQKTRIAGLLLICIGGFLSLSGLQVLGPLIDAAGGEIPSNGSRAHLLMLTDTLVTALLIGGGAHGIHKIMKRILSEASV